MGCVCVCLSVCRDGGDAQINRSTVVIMYQQAPLRCQGVGPTATIEATELTS